MSLTEGSDYYVRLLDFGCCSVSGAVRPNEDGTYSVYINSRLSRDQQHQALLHELKHICRADFYNDLEIYEIEEN